MASEEHQAKFRTHLEIRARGAIGNLAEGPVIRTHGVRTRLIAWPGTGYQTESVHVLTLSPGEATSRYTYGVAEEAMLCVKGMGEAFVRGEWLTMKPGDLAYFPEGVEHAVRNPAGNERDFILVSQITPPQLDLYIDGGFYHKELGVMNFDAIRKAIFNAHPGELSSTHEMAYHDTHREMRPWSLTPEQIRSGGALFNVYRGAEFSGIGVGPMRLVLWPGSGTRGCGFNYAYVAPRVPDVAHHHPVSDECLVLWAGRAQVFVADRWIDIEPLDVVLAPCGVIHGHRSDQPTFFGGFASPPQHDLLINTPYYRDGQVMTPAYEELRLSDCVDYDLFPPGDFA
jgi:mannose-6-phosphate isomerase-like protein (cupin superfamily)